MVTPGLSGSRQRHAGPASQRQPLLLAMQAIEVDPSLGAAVGHAQSKPGVSLIEVFGLTTGGRSNALYGGCGEGSVGH